MRWIVRSRLGMDRDDVRSRLGKGVEEIVDRRDHQMHVEWLGRVRPERLHHRGANGDVGHEMAVHDVDMDPVGPGHVDGADFLAQPRKIGRQDRRGNQGCGHGSD
jgi:hypothetical protein